MPFVLIFMLVGTAGSYIAGETLLKEESEQVIEGDLEIVDEMEEAPVAPKPTKNKKSSRRK